MAKEKGFKERYIVPFAATGMALITGFGFSGSIILAGALLQSTFSFISPLVYQGIINVIFTINILTQASIQYGGMESLLNGGEKTALDKVNVHINEIKKIASILHENINNTQLIDQLKRRLKTDINNEIKLIEAESNRSIAANTGISGTIKYYAELIPGVTYFSHYLSGQHAKDQRLNYLRSLQTVAATSIGNMPQHEDLYRIFKQMVEFDIPQKPADSISSSAYNALHSATYLMTIINAWAINSIGFIMFGSLSMIQLIGINQVSVQYSIACLFYIVGAISSLSFSGPAVINTIKVLFGFDKEANTILNSARDKSQRAGFFKLPSFIQKALAIFIAAAIAVGNTIANIAFGEFLFSGKSLFDSTLISSLMANPLSAHTYSLIFGLMGGLLTLTLVSTLFINGTLTITPVFQQNKPKKGLIENCLSYCIKAAKCASAVTAMFTAVAMYHRHRIIPFLVSHANIILLSSVSILAMIESYNQCYTEGASMIANLFVTITLVSTTMVTLYLNLLPGSLFFQVMPAVFAKGCAILSAIANAELTLPLCKLATHKIDEVVNTSDHTVSHYIKKPVRHSLSQLFTFSVS